MTTPIATREAALRMGLAARQLDGLDVRALVNALVEKLDVPITEVKLSALTVEDLRQVLAGDFAEQGCFVSATSEQLKDAVRLLWGQGVEGSDLPQIESLPAGGLPGSIRVAVANNRGENLDGHFGSAERFLIYQVAPDDLKLVEVRTALEADQADDKNAARSQLLNDCQLVYVQSIGGPAAAKVVRAGVHPVKKPEGGVAREVLRELQQRLLSPPPWLAQVMGLSPVSLHRFVGAETGAQDTAAPCGY